ncbi:MarR family transcriptional regulator [Solihabitans fulvus]|uniref:MarR family transcriptional regulator n=1 Tax=Solihabitans fulvus TaxID=1892852 RepID=A0A5B2WZE3_9PSEU|nr:MarR family transcriptional regulator [Solihabitans fulvus]KAA2256320.1 MarR family transcriptional regulator [Solihabitans fulvus]
MTPQDSHADTAARVWQGMRAFVLELYDRRKEAGDALDMSFVRAKALRYVGLEPMTMRQLTAILATDAPYTTVVVDDLERRGLVERSVHPGDRRVKIVTATEAGKAAAAVVQAIMDRPPPPMLDLDPADLAALERIIATLVGESAPQEPST